MQKGLLSCYEFLARPKWCTASSAIHWKIPLQHIAIPLYKEGLDYIFSTSTMKE
jgi:hypothetical protein